MCCRQGCCLLLSRAGLGLVLVLGRGVVGCWVSRSARAAAWLLLLLARVYDLQGGLSRPPSALGQQAVDLDPSFNAQPRPAELLLLVRQGQQAWQRPLSTACVAAVLHLMSVVGRGHWAGSRAQCTCFATVLSRSKVTEFLLGRAKTTAQPARLMGSFLSPARWPAPEIAWHHSLCTGWQPSAALDTCQAKVSCAFLFLGVCAVCCQHYFFSAACANLEGASLPKAVSGHSRVCPVNCGLSRGVQLL